MKLLSSHSARRQSGVLIIECIAYIAIFFIVIGLGYESLYRCWSLSASVRRSADDINQSLAAGERWRADIRSATGPIDASVETLRIPQAKDAIIYTFANGQIHRRNAEGRESTALTHVKASRMEQETRPSGAVWRWELELAPSRKTPVRPLFSFAAVAPNGGSHDH